MRQATAGPSDAGAWQFCVAPMMDWTDRHCRRFHRLLSRKARLYTEMLTTGALIYGDAGRHLEQHPSDGPVALQIGGSEPDALAKAAQLGARYGYAEINLNCGCPSERVQRGAFGACLMREAERVADCFAAVSGAVDLPVTVKHRLGLGRDTSLDLVCAFVDRLARAGCRVFIVHARNAWLKGLSPKDNRDVPPLRHADVHRLASLFPDSRFVINGGLSDHLSASAAAQGLEGVMVGRAAYRTPAMLAEVDHIWYGEKRQTNRPLTPCGSASESLPALLLALEGYRDYMQQECKRGTPFGAMARPLLGVFQGFRGARAWRQSLSNARALRAGDLGVFDQAVERFLTIQRTEAT
jgi:tRNA-dihydrouridine synthase A